MLKKGLSIILIIATVISVILVPVTVNAATKTFDEIVRTAGTVIRTSEGVYSSINRDDNGAVSIGILQWHANRALNLLKTVVNANKTNAKKILGDKMYNEILTSNSWVDRILTVDEAKVVSTLLDTAEGHAAQDKLIYDDVASYIHHGNSLTLTNPLTLVYYADLENQCGFGGASRIANAAIEKAGNKEITLDMLHKASLEDSVAGRYATRRNKAYNLCMLLGWDDVGYPCEVWTATTYLNLRPEAGIYNTPVGGLSAGQSAVITEKVFFDDNTWGRCFMGWICLDFCDYIKGDIPCHIAFDAGEGTLASDIRAKVTASAYNTVRLADQIVVYDGDLEAEKTPTNVYGGEIAVDKDGKVLSNLVYGSCKTKIPEGGFVLSGIGKGYSWLYGYVSLGNYVWFDKNTYEISVYPTRAEYIANRKYVNTGKKIGELPIPERKGYLFNGWVDINGKSVVSSDTYSSHLSSILFATWKSSECAISYDLCGGEFVGTSSYKISGENKQRLTNELIVYNNAGEMTGTNIYGREVAVSNEGFVTEVFPYETGNHTVPTGGYILSGNGEASTFLKDNVTLGNYIVIDKGSGTANVYSSKEYYYVLNKQLDVFDKVGELPRVERFGYEFVCWKDHNGNEITPDTVIPYNGLAIHAEWKLLPGKLIFDTAGGSIGGAVATLSVSGTNITRPADKIILYKDKATTGTNVYGYEAAIDKNGNVTALYPYGQGNAAIPEGGFVLSATSTAGGQIYANLTPGRAVKLNGNTVTVYANGSDLRAASSPEVYFGSEYGALPTPTKSGYIFGGWIDKNEKDATENTSVSVLGDVVLTAKWIPAVTVTLDTKGGKVSPESSVTADGVNIQRTANTLVIYEGKATTGTNPYGYEVVVDKTGKVIRAGSVGNSDIPELGAVISAHGTKVSLISSVKAGYHIDIKGKYIYIYNSDISFEATTGKVTIEKGGSLGAIPVPAKTDSAFVGWMGNTGELSKDTVISENCTYTAKWTETSAHLMLDTAGGIFDGGVTASLAGVNIHRAADTIVLYKDKATTGTNTYGTEVIIKYDGHGGNVIGIIPQGQGNAAIPSGCAVLSGHGKGSTWLSSNITLGSYIDISGNTLTAYKSAADSPSYYKEKVIKPGEKYGTIPTPQKYGCVFVGWTDGAGNTVTESTVVKDLSYAAHLTAEYAAEVSVTFEGFDSDIDTLTSDGINKQRTANLLIIYEGVTSTGTNPYGAEAVVDKNGIVTSVSPGGKGNNTVPEGGFVISAHGTRSGEVGKIKVGNFVVLNGKTLKIYSSKDTYDAISGIKYASGRPFGYLPSLEKTGYDFAGWYDGDTPVTVDTVVTGVMHLAAKWTPKAYTVTLDLDGGELFTAKAVANGVNTGRLADQLIIQTIPEGESERTFTNNEFGRVAVCSADGKVESVLYGVTSTTLKNGQFALSGNGVMSTWIKDNVIKDCYVTLDGMTVTVSSTAETNRFHSGTATVYYGEPVGKLPDAKKEGYDFIGWSVGGKMIDETYTVTGNTTVKAVFEEKKLTVVFDPNGGTLETAAHTYKPDGVNVQRTADKLIIYKDKASTGTNPYGTEAVVDKNGTVTAIYGNGNNSIPDGGFVISAHGKAVSFIKNEIRVGMYCEFDGTTLSVWSAKANKNISGVALRVSPSAPIGDLPVPTRNGYVFICWKNGDEVLKCDTVIKSFVSYTAVWGTKKAGCTANGTNIARLQNQLIVQTIPDGMTERVFTNNAYGRIAVCDKSGKVISVTYGNTSTVLKNGQFALSGNGTMSTWIADNVHVGDYITVSGTAVTAAIIQQ